MGGKVATKKNWKRWYFRPELLSGLLAALAGSIWSRTPAGSSALHHLLLVFEQDSESVLRSDVLFVDDNRTLKARNDIPERQVLVEIPRRVQIWDVDAFANPLIRQHLLGARHNQSQHAIRNQAYLAIHIDMMRSALTSQLHSSHKAYVQYLPSAQDFQKFHPVFQDDEMLAASLGKHSYAYMKIQQNKNQFQSEFQALCTQYPDFPNIVQYGDFVAARLQVSTRTFKLSGPLDPTQVLRNQDSITLQDLEFFEATVEGWSLQTTGVSILVPVMDAFNHHPARNLQHFYNNQTSKFKLVSNQKIAVGNELYVSYGTKWFDSKLYATYGFVQGDGSGGMGTLFSAFHSMDDPRVNIPPKHDSSPEFQDYRAKKYNELVEYLRYDDGYQDCVLSTRENSAAMQVKGLKLQLLEILANDEEKWRFYVLSLWNQKQEPITETDTAESILAKQYNLEFLDLEKLPQFRALLSTCRILGMNDRDMDGKAREFLQSIVRQLSQLKTVQMAKFYIPEGGAGMEFRARGWMHRLARIMLERHDTTSDQEARKILVSTPGSFEWATSHVRLGEMKLLELLLRYSHDYMLQHRSATDIQEDFMIRDEPCPAEYSAPVLEGMLAIH